MYHCPGCGIPAETISINRRAHIGVTHSPECWFYRLLKKKFPDLIERIEQERAVA